MVTMTVYSEVKRLYSSLQEMVGLRRRKRQLQIVRPPHTHYSQPCMYVLTMSIQSEPFNFKQETTILPGLTEDEYAPPSPPLLQLTP